MIRPVNSISMDQLPHFFFCAVHFLIKSNAVWNPMLTDKAVVRSMDGIFGRSTGRGVGWGGADYIQSVYSCRNKMLHLVYWKQSREVMNHLLMHTLGSCLITPGNIAILEAQCWSLPLKIGQLVVAIAWSFLVSGSQCC